MQREGSEKRVADFQEFEATSLYCPRCKAEVPVRKRLLLVLVDGEIYEYFCAHCAESLGSKTVKGQEQVKVLV
ncbi:MAG: cytoplasmic protein [Proteobacteria bacterium]|nr:cytoplasmic protein [Pseudomonadota bacterium]